MDQFQNLLGIWPVYTPCKKFNFYFYISPNHYYKTGIYHLIISPDQFQNLLGTCPV